MDMVLRSMEGEDMEGVKKLCHFGHCSIHERDV
jgi:hypothetical protein